MRLLIQSPPQRRRLTLCAVFFCILSTTGCLDSNFRESIPKFTTDKTRIEVSADPQAGKTEIKDTLTVISTESWSAEIWPEADWVRISTNSDLNLSGSLEYTDIVLSFDEYADRTQDRTGTSLIITTTGHDPIEIPVVQKALAPRMSVTGNGIPKIAAEGGSFAIDVLSNWHWSVTVQEGSADFVSIDTPEGYRDGSITVSVSPTSDTDSEREGVLVLKCEGCENIEIRFTQDALVPMLKIDMAEVCELPVPCGGEQPVIFSCNEHWRATLKDVSAGVSLSTEEGDIMNNELSVIFPEIDVYTESCLVGRKATVVITTDSGLTDEVTFVQNCIVLPFRKYPDTFGWSQTNTCLKEDGTNSTENVLPRNSNGKKGETGPIGGEKTIRCHDHNGYGYILWTGDATGDLYIEANGVVIGSLTEGLTPESPAFSISTPAVEGLRLSRVQMMLGLCDEDRNGKNWEVYATGTTAAITDGAIVISGGEPQTVSDYAPAAATTESFAADITDNQASMFDFRLNDTTAGKSYLIVGTYRMVIRWIIFHYEQE